MVIDSVRTSTVIELTATEVKRAVMVLVARVLILLMIRIFTSTPSLSVRTVRTEIGMRTEMKMVAKM